LILSIFAIVGIIIGLLIRKGKLLEIKLKVFEDQSKADKWIGLNIIFSSLVLGFYGIMLMLSRTTFVSHIMLVVIFIFFMIRIKVGPDKSS
jgi:hypothetical protein